MRGDEPRVSRVAAGLGLAGAVLGVALLLLRSFVPDSLSWVGPLRPATLTGVVLAGLALVGLGRPASPPALRVIARAMAAAALALAVLTLALFVPGERLMAVPSAALLLLCSVAIQLAASARLRVARAAQTPAALALALALLLVLGHLYRIDSLSGMGAFAAPLWVAVSSSLLGAAVLVARPEFGLARVLARRSPGAEHLRRELPALLGVPLAAGLITALGVRVGAWDQAFSLALFTLLSMAALGVVGGVSSRRIDVLAREQARLGGLFRRTFENAAVGVAHLDAEGHWLRVNDRLCEIVSWSREELLRRTLADVSHPDDRSVVLAVHRALQRGETDSNHFELRCVTKQGHELWIDVVISAERAARHGIAFLTVVVQDVSARKRAEADLELAQRALVCSSDGVIIASTRRPEGEIVYVNPAFTRITGWTPEQVLGQSWRFLSRLDPGEPPLDERCRALGHDETVSALLHDVRSDGQEVWSEIRIAPVVDSQSAAVTHHVGVLEDASERHAAAAERERLLGEALDARAEAERAGRAKDEFFALVSHELRSPLATLTSWLSVLRGERKPELRTRALEVVERNAALLKRLIGDLLDASRIISGKLEIELQPVDLVELARAAVTALGPVARDRDVELSLVAPEAAAFVLGDPDRMDQVLRNLIENAIKFTPAGGRIDVTLHLHGNEIELCVRDSGQGIAPEFLPFVFERFRQQGAQTDAAAGLGLGLFVVRNLVELHGGRVDVESEGPGRGTTLRVRLPAARILEARPSRPAADDAGPLDDQRVWLLEPDRAAAEALAIALEEAEADVVWLRGAGEALVQPPPRPDVLVAEVDVLGDEAAELLRTLRALPSASERPLVAVALSTMRTPDAKRRVRSAGFDAHLVRPFEPSRLIALIRSLRSKPGRVLVVDDDRDAADSLALLLSRRGFEVARAYDAENALALAKSFAPAVVVTDLGLGSHNGLEIVRALRAVGAPGLRIVAVTGRSADDLGAESGLLDGFARKPVEFDALLELIR